MKDNMIVSMLGVVSILAFVFVIAKVFIIPVIGEHAKIESMLAETIIERDHLQEQLKKVKWLVRNDLLDVDDTCLNSYITANTTNLTDPMIKEIATAITFIAYNSGLPLAIMVGLAETRSQFNPTTLNGDLRGLYQVDEFLTTKPKRLHEIEFGTKAGCDLMVEKLTSAKGDITKALIMFTFEKHNKSFIAKVYENTAKFVAHQYKFNVAYQKKINIIKLVEKNNQEVVQEGDN